MENVTVQMETGDEVEVLNYIPSPKLVYDTPGTTYTCVGFSDDPTQGKNLLINYGSRRFQCQFQCRFLTFLELGSLGWWRGVFNTLSANLAKWSNTLKQHSFLPAPKFMGGFSFLKFGQRGGS